MYHWVRDCANSYMNLIKKKDSVDEDINISLHSETMSYFVEETFSAIVLARAAQAMYVVKCG